MTTFLRASRRGTNTYVIPVRTFVALVSLCLGGCHLLGGMQVEAVATSVEPPSNVALYLSVTDTSTPVPELTAASFKIYEDGQLVDAAVTRQTLLERSLVAVHRTVLLLDLSGAPDDATKTAIAEGAAKLANAVAPKQGVAVYVFDGGSDVVRVADVTQGSSVESLPAVAAFAPRDSSRNLNGAVVEALSALGAALMAEKKPVRVGALVILARGPDLARRVLPERTTEAIESSAHAVFAIGVGEDPPDFRLEDFGPAGVTRAKATSSLPGAFEEMAKLLLARDASYHLLSYCSPARSGVRQLEVEVVVKDAEGAERSSSLQTEFDATGFGPGCDPGRTPRFIAGPLPAPAGSPDTDEEEAPKKKAPRPKPSGGSKPPPPSEKPSGPATDDDGIVPPPDRPGYAPNR